MYLNKLLFPAPNRQHDGRLPEKELIWITRNTSLKDFKINRKDHSYSTSKKKSNLPTFSLFKTKQHKNCPKEPPSIHALNLEPGSANKLQSNTIFEHDSYFQRKSDITSTRPVLQFPKTSFEEDKEQEIASAASPKKLDFDANEEHKKDDDKSKKKKKKGKAACLGFLPKLNKDKKITLEAFDGSQPLPPSLEFGAGTALGNIGSDIADSIIHRNKQQLELGKESSSDSEDDTPQNGKKIAKIPCLYIKSRVRSQKTILYFHGNGEDLGSSYEFLQNLSHNLFMDIIAIEYPGYGLYPGSSSEKKILLDAETVYNYVTTELHIKEEDILLFGRSIGSGPATWLASIKNPGMLILMSPFTSIRAVAKHLAGNLGKYIVKERFKNSELMKQVECPVFIIHGKKDNLIPIAQPMKLYDTAKGRKEIYVGEEMTHSDFDFFGDIAAPLTKWLKELNMMNFKQNVAREPEFDPVGKQVQLAS